MRYVILRDDDTNALTPPECLELLYRPFLDRGLPVNLATIPEVNVRTKIPNGDLEGFLAFRNGCKTDFAPLASNQELIQYLRANPGYKILQHGCHHDWHEFDRTNRFDITERLNRGAQALQEAGFGRPETFVAPYDKLSRASYTEVARRFHVISTGWFEARRLPFTWWPRFALKKRRRADHWHIRDTLLLSHPGCILSRHRPREGMLQAIRDHVANHSLTVLVTHWWEYFRDRQPDAGFIEVLHQTADFLGSEPNLKVISFADLPARADDFVT